MRSTADRSLAQSGAAPWFRRRPILTMAVAFVLYVAVFILRIVIGPAEEAIALYFGLPIALLAISFGFRAGIAAALFAIVLVIGWAVAGHVDLGWIAWGARLLPLLLLAALLGDASDRLRSSEMEQLKLRDASLQHREAIEINDTLIQGMAATKWALEAGRVESGLETLSQTMSAGHELVSDLLRRVGMGHEITEEFLGQDLVPAPLQAPEDSRPDHDNEISTA